MRDAKCYHSSVILRNYIAQDMLLTRIYKDVITRVRYEHIKKTRVSCLMLDKWHINCEILFYSRKYKNEKKKDNSMENNRDGKDLR